MSIGKNIKKRRLEVGMTLEEVAKKVGVSRQTLSRYETGVIDNIPPHRIEQMAKVLRTTPAALIGWDDKSILELVAEDNGLNHAKKLLSDLRMHSEQEKNKPAESELDELDKELLRLAAQLTPEQKRRQVETLRDIVGKKDN